MQPAPPLSLASGIPQKTRTDIVNSVTYLGKERMDDEGSEILHLCSSVYYRSRIFALPILASEQIGVAAIAVCVRGLTRGGGIDACLKTHVPAKEMIALSALINPDTNRFNPADFVRPRILRGVHNVTVRAGEVVHGTGDM